jgi:hypothetical protein
MKTVRPHMWWVRVMAVGAACALLIAACGGSTKKTSTVSSAPVAPAASSSKPVATVRVKRHRVTNRDPMQRPGTRAPRVAPKPVETAQAPETTATHSESVPIVTPAAAPKTAPEPRPAAEPKPTPEPKPAPEPKPTPEPKSSAQSAEASGIPQGNGGDMDADNNGGPSDGDGNF